MNIQEIRTHNSFIHSRFYYTYDDPKHDSWKSHAKNLIDIPGYKIYDDCDGLASTTAHYLNIFGAKQVWRILCSMEGGPVIDHMIAMVKSDSGQDWIVGDTGNNIPVKRQDWQGRFFLFNSINDGINWTEVPKETI
jgi:hypothetical protein